MPKIKGWERKQLKENDFRPFFWKHESESQVVVNHPPNRYQVIIARSNGRNHEKFLRIGTKERARKRAIKWMRNHPNG